MFHCIIIVLTSDFSSSFEWILQNQHYSFDTFMLCILTCLFFCQSMALGGGREAEFMTRIVSLKGSQVKKDWEPLAFSENNLCSTEICTCNTNYLWQITYYQIPLSFLTPPQLLIVSCKSNPQQTQIKLHAEVHFLNMHFTRTCIDCRCANCTLGGETSPYCLCNTAVHFGKMPPGLFTL